MATKGEVSVSPSDFSSNALDGLFDSFGEETMSDDNYIRSYDDVGELNNETDCDSGIIFDRYLDGSVKASKGKFLYSAVSSH